MRPERRRAYVPPPPPPEDDQTGWLITFSDLVLQLFAFVLVSAVLLGAAQAPKTADAAPPSGPPAPCVAAPEARVAWRPSPARVEAAPAPEAAAAAPAPEPAAPPPVAVADDAAPAPSAAPEDADAQLTSVERSLREFVAAEGRDDAVHVAVRDSNLIVTVSDTISFPSASADLLPTAAPILRRIGALARSMPDFDLEVAGHTDDVPIHTGGFPSNLELSLARAARVVHEIAAEAPELTERTVAAGYGEHRPVASNGDEQGRAQNRRVEIRLVPRPASRG